ncbi:Sel1 repeat family protein [Rhizophagus clarus]|uniref:Sel1 repeat family protein n=1 Tax=Rhizophagus clarus TaxID=94130 RepID=A0A8H3M1B0_9GLOM|nr:Sel1 repeat family protein [Rhizophagus clarus]
MSSNQSTNRPVNKDDEDFLIKILKDFYYKIIETKEFNNFENISIKWIRNEIINNKKSTVKILELMQNHEESNVWFTSLMGFFYQFGIGCNIDKKRAMELYYLAINNETEKNFLNENFSKKQLIENLLELAKNGDFEAQYNLAICYKNGSGIETNYEKAFKWLLSSAENKNPEAQYHLAIFYMDGIGVQKDEKEAFNWFSKSEQSGYLDIQNKNERESFEKNLKLAIANDAIAQDYLGYCYQFGKGISKNETKAFGWYLKSANAGFAGYAEGQFNLGYCYENAIGTGKNETKAFEWYLRSAIAGNTKAQNRLGKCYIDGIGTNKNKIKAFNWFLKSAEQGDEEGQYNLGCCYQYGEGIGKNEKKAFELYSKLAEKGNAAAQNNLGHCYQYGIGVYVNEKKAFELYVKSAENGNTIAQNNLGYCFKYGKGVTKSKKKSFKWYSISAKNGNVDAQNYIKTYKNDNAIKKVKDDFNNILSESKQFPFFKKIAFFRGRECEVETDIEENTKREAENTELKSKVGELEARLAILEQSPPIVDGQLQNDKKVTSEASVVVVSDSSSFHEVYSQLKLSRSKMYQRKRNKEKKLSNAGQDQVSLQKISDTASGISSSEKLVNTKNGQGLIQEILTTLMNPPLLHSTGALSPNPPEISLISVNIICLYQRASNAEGLAMKANQEEILSWYLCAKEFLIMVKDIMASDRVGIDKVRYIKTCSANSISKITNTDLQKVIDHFSNNSNSSTEAEISSTSCHPNHVTKIFETVCSKKVSPEVNVSTTPKPAEVTSSNRSRLPISILPEDPEEKRKHIIGLVLERFPNLYLIDSSEHCEWFNFNNSTLCLLRKDHKEESLWNNIKGEWGPGNYYGEQTYRILCKDPLNPGTPIVSGLRHTADVA